MRLKSHLVTALFPLFVALTTSVASQAESIAPDTPPETGVIDAAQVLPLSVLKATERILQEHQHLTQETVYLVTTPTENPELETAAQSLVDTWKANAPKPPNTVLIAVDAAKGTLVVRAGVGLDALVGPGSERIREVRRTHFDPEWKVGKKSRALVFAIIETLRALESPLIESGEAIEAYEHAGFSGGWVPVAPAPKTTSTWIWLSLSGLVFAFALYRTLAVEVHTTSEGWHRVPVSEVLTRRLRKKAGPDLITGGGVSGRY